jgi:hypothetical protein
MTTYYGVYSEKQFRCMLSKESREQNDFPYIYYQKEDSGEIVQITEVLHDKEGKSLYNDAIYLGPVKYYKVYKERQNF